MTNDNSTIQSDNQRAAIALLRAGMATPSEVARLAGVSRQLINHWIGPIDWRKARSRWLSRQWHVKRRARPSR